MRACFILALAVGCLPLQAGAEGTAGQSTRFALDDRGGVVVPVSLNGQGPFRFLLDTGSTHSFISDAVAHLVNAPAVAQTSVSSAAGAQMRLVVRIDRLECGPLTLSDVLPAIVDLDAPDFTHQIDGVLGQDVLAPVRYTIDFRRQQLLWWPEVDPAPPAASTFTLEATGGRFVISLPQRSSTLRLVPDSGAETLLLFDDGHHGALPAIAFEPGRTLLTSVTAQRTVREARVLELRIGGRSLRDIRAVVVGRQPMETTDTNGLLPLHLFGRVTFDGPRRLLILEG